MLVATLKLLLFAITVSAHEVKLQLDKSLDECNDKCGCAQSPTIESCLSLDDEDGTVTFLFLDSSEPPSLSTSKICKECYNLTKIINIIQEESKEIPITTLKTSENTFMSLLEIPEKGFLGLAAMHKLYLVTVENNDGLFFCKYTFHEVVEEGDSSMFYPTLDLSFKPCSTEIITFLYFLTFEDGFIIADIMEVNDLVLDQSQRFMDCSMYLYYTAVFLMCMSLLLLCVRNRDLVKKYRLRRSAE